MVIEAARLAGIVPVVALDPGGAADLLGVPIRGGDELMEEVLAEGGIDAGIVALGSNGLRRKLGLRLRALGCAMPPVIHPAAIVSASARIGPGSQVMAGAIVQARAEIGADCIINTGAIVEHDCVVGDGVHVAPRSVMGGSCRLGDGTLFGIGAVARPGTTIGAGVVVGAGAVVVADVVDGATVVGNPAAPLKPR